MILRQYNVYSIFHYSFRFEMALSGYKGLWDPWRRVAGRSRKKKAPWWVDLPFTNSHEWKYGLNVVISLVTARFDVAWKFKMSFFYHIYNPRYPGIYQHLKSALIRNKLQFHTSVISDKAGSNVKYHGANTTFVNTSCNVQCPETCELVTNLWS